MENDLVYWNNIKRLKEELELENTSGLWRLSINSPKVSLKAMLLHHGNTFPSIPLDYAAHMKEAYENLHILLLTVRYKEHL
jgi:hypothetical protein